MTFDLTGFDETEKALAAEAIAEAVDANAPGMVIVFDSVRRSTSPTQRASILSRLRRVLYTEKQLVAALPKE